LPFMTCYREIIKDDKFKTFSVCIFLFISWGIIYSIVY